MSRARESLLDLSFVRTDPTTPALLALHGFTGRAESWLDTLALADVPCAVLDLPGHHPHSPLPPNSSFDDQPDRIASWCEALSGTQPFVVVGYSMGARLALGLCVRHPRLVSRAVLVGVHPGLTAVSQRSERRQLEAGWIETLSNSGLETFLRDWEQHPVFAGQKERAPAAFARQAELRRTHDPIALARAVEVLGLGSMPDYTLAQAGVPCPVDLVVGQDDHKFQTIASEMARVIHTARIQVVEECGHNVPLEKPGVMARIIREAVKEEDGA